MGLHHIKAIDKLMRVELVEKNIDFNWGTNLREEKSIASVTSGQHTIDLSYYDGDFILVFGGYFDNVNTYYTYLKEEEFLFKPVNKEDLEELLVIHMIKYLEDDRRGKFFNVHHGINTPLNTLKIAK